jgi:hypothetical protein
LHKGGWAVLQHSPLPPRGSKKSRIFEKFVSFTVYGRKNRRKFAMRPKNRENRTEK